MNCPKCGAANNQDAKFCNACGNQLGNQLINENTVNQNSEPVEILEVQEPVLQPTTNNIESVEVSEPIEQATIQEPTLVTMLPNSINESLTTDQAPVNNINTVPKEQPKNKSKWIIIGAIIAVVVIIICSILLYPALVKNSGTTEQKQIDNLFNPDRLIRVKSGNKYGYINAKGKLVIKQNYDYATEFRGDHSIVRLEVNDNGMIKTVNQIIDSKGNVKKQTAGEIKYIDETASWVIDGELYNSSVKKVSPEGVKVEHQEEHYFLWINAKEKTGGVMNEKGKAMYTHKFKENQNSIDLEISKTDETQKQTYCIVNIDYDDYGIINCDTGKIVYDFVEDKISTYRDNIFEIRDKDTYELKETVYIQNDKVLYTSTNKDIDLYYYQYYVKIRDDSKPYDERYSYLDLATGEVSDEKPETPSGDEIQLNEWESYTKNKKFSCSTGYGLMNDDKITLPCEWTSIDYLEIKLYKYLENNNKQYVYGRKDSKWYLIDLKTKAPIIEFNTSTINQSNNSTFIYYTDLDLNNKKVYNLISNKSLSIDTEESLAIYSNYITVQNSKNQTIKYYNTDLELIYTEAI